ncbi:MAG: ABC transporter ATP-binding protein [Deltaproteobacteria bacterium]|nr:ABC transporter ATP-binding protein [Candidatus Zymogenaceae bacterium]
MNTDYAIQITGLTKVYNTGTVLNVGERSFIRGKIYGLVGPNGSGKSTLLSILAHLTPPTAGTILLSGTDTTLLPSPETRRRITLVHQEPVMFHTSVKKNVAMGLIYHDVPKQERKLRVLEALRAVGMEGFATRNARTLSGGEKKRVAVARALAISPDILLLDEPTANVDGTNAGRIEQIIRRINETAGMTIIFSTHNLNQAYRLSHEVVTLMYGKTQGTSLMNIFSGVAEKENGEPVFYTGRARIKLPVFEKDVQQISVNPNDIIISKEPVSSSARNCFSGQIIEMMKDGDRVTVTVRTDEDFRITVTDRSVREMGLFIGEEVSIAFKASSITMYHPQGEM